MFSVVSSSPSPPLGIPGVTAAQAQQPSGSSGMRRPCSYSRRALGRAEDVPDFRLQVRAWPGKGTANPRAPGMLAHPQHCQGAACSAHALLLQHLMHEAAVLAVWFSLEPEMKPFPLVCMVFLLTAGILKCELSQFTLIR